MTDDRLAGRHVIVTGGARGMGRGVAVRAAEAGADVSVFDVRTGVAGETAERVRDVGSECEVIEVDVSDPEAVERGVGAAVEALGPVHGLVNCAGIQDVIPIVETTAEEWDRYQAVNARGTFLCCKAVAEHMIDEDMAGSLVNIASTAALDPAPGQGAYAASKGAVAAFTNCLATELGVHGIAANSINPGAIDTPMYRAWLEQHAERGGPSPEERYRQSADAQFRGRIGRPEDVGHVAVLLLSEEGEWITGEAFTVRGGRAEGV